MDWSSLIDRRVHIVGIKGSGCAALAEILHARGAIVSGSDGPEDFYTSALLHALNINVYTQFSEEHVTSDLDIVIHSAAYTMENPELRRAIELDLEVINYPHALGKLSKHSFGVAVAGVHGKTTTTAMLGLITKDQGWSVSVLVGSQVPGFGDRATYVAGNDLFIAETCEYREHFRHFSPKAIIITAIEWDHQDYFKHPNDMDEAFTKFILQLPTNGLLLYNGDCPGTLRVVTRCKKERSDIEYHAYGRGCANEFPITDEVVTGGYNEFHLNHVTPSVVSLQMAGKHNIANASAALVMAALLAKKHQFFWNPELAIQTLKNFRGLARRLEVIGVDRQKNILILDDYAHHPTAIATTLEGLRTFYPNRRIILSFMSHTYSRTQALLDEFAKAISMADVLFLHKIYASARESKPDDFSSSTLLEATQKYMDDNLIYVEEPIEALALVKSLLKDDDVFVTMGAGDNFHLSHQLARELGLLC